jgi:predicted ester cyclase
MNPSEVAEKFQRSAEQGDWDTMNQVLAEDFLFYGPMPEPLGQRECVSMHKALWGGFPDISYNLRIIGSEGNIVKAIVHITGTHTGLLIPPVPGEFVSIPPTGKKISLAKENIEYTVRGNQLATIKLYSSPESSWPGIFRQIGVENPYETG